MAQNNMEVIIYKILRYLYECMKTGKTRAAGLKLEIEAVHNPERVLVSDDRDSYRRGSGQRIPYYSNK
jgi:hypothetical protein